MYQTATTLNRQSLSLWGKKLLKIARHYNITSNRSGINNRLHLYVGQHSARPSGVIQELFWTMDTYVGPSLGRAIEKSVRLFHPLIFFQKWQNSKIK